MLSASMASQELVQASIHVSHKNQTRSLEDASTKSFCMGSSASADPALQTSGLGAQEQSSSAAVSYTHLTLPTKLEV